MKNDNNNTPINSGGNVPNRKRKPRRLPLTAKLRLDETLAANENHPLAKSAPEARTQSRLRIIAGILARLARAGLARGA
jgi:hypothetical protein